VNKLGASTLGQGSRNYLYSTFTDDRFIFLFDSMLNNFEGLKTEPIFGKIRQMKFKIGTTLCKIIDILLNKFLVNTKRLELQKSHIETSLKTARSNPYLAQIAS
jgi:hypothetical protein